MTSLQLAASTLTDAFGRVARDLRVSLTDRCNLRCTYCMPADGLAWFPTEDVLTDDEVVRVIGIAVERLGVEKLRFTGGEPLLRGGLEGIIAATKQLRTARGVAPETSLTTNGVGLDKRVKGLAAAGLDRVNVSLDSLDRERYAALARRDRLPDVLAGLAAAEAAGLTPVKVNAVVMRGVNEADVVPLAAFCLARRYQLRF
ncbi:MAG: radical SAM protein, partial [Micropruina sp.]